MSDYDFARLYAWLYGMLAADGREERLLGSCGALAQRAFESCAVGSAMPVVYFELPLMGEPRFDLHVCIDRSSVEWGYELPPSAPEALGPLLGWLVGQDDCTGVECAFDVSAGDVRSPQLVVLPKSGGVLRDAEGFFTLVGSLEAAARYRASEARAPEGWEPWYTGYIERRMGSPVRLDYFVDRRLKDAYARDVVLFARDLRQMGYEPSDEELAWCRELLALPLGVNLQLDILEDGTTGPTLGYSVYVRRTGPGRTREMLERGSLGEAFRLLEGWGIADGRWQLLGGCCRGLSVRLPVDGDVRELAIRCVVNSVKVRMTPEGRLDAKAYLMCSMGVLRRGT